MEIPKTTDGLAQQSEHRSKWMLQSKIQNPGIFKHVASISATRRHTANWT